MRAKRISTVLLIHIFGSKTIHVLSSLGTFTVSALFALRETNVVKCQKCLLSTAGALRAKLISKNPAQCRLSSTCMKFTAEYIVTAPFFGFANMEQNCAAPNLCGLLTVGYGFDSTRRSSLMQYQFSKDEKEPPGSLLCLIRKSTSAKCRNCLREASDSAYLGDFRVIPTKAKNLLTMYVLSTTRKVDYIVEACTASLACSKGTAYIPARVCASLILNGPMRNTPIMEETEVILESTKAFEATNFLGVENHLIPVTLKQYCIGPIELTPDSVVMCMKCLAVGANGVTVMLPIESGSGARSFFFHALAQDATEGFWNSCDSRCDKQHPTAKDNHVCNNLNALQFDMSPIEDRISVGTSERMQNEQKSIATAFSSKCVWATFEQGEEYCNECITNLGASVSIAGLSPTMSLSLLRSDFDNKKLAACILAKVTVFPKCHELVFVPDFMCEFDIANSAQQFGPNNGKLYQTIPHPQRLQLFGKQHEAQSNVLSTGYRIGIPHECLKYLALKRDILLISLAKRYIWLLNEHPDNSIKNECSQWFLHLGTLHYDAALMPSIPAADMDELFAIPKDKRSWTTKYY